MRAAVAITPGTGLEMADVRLGDLGPHDVRVRIEAAGICHSDLKPIDPRTPAHNWPFIGGHEGVGTVLATGDRVVQVVVGERVLASFVSPCRSCYWCTLGQQSLCVATAAARPKGWLGEAAIFGHAGLGVFAEEAIMHEAAAVPVRSELSSAQVALVSCGVTTGVCAAFNAPGLACGGSAVVIGLGGVGLSVIQGAEVAGAEVLIGVDPVPMKRELALTMGATHVIDPLVEDVVERVRELTRGRGADVAFDAYGHPDVATQGFHSIRRGGRLVLVGAKNDSVGGWTLHEQMTSSKEVVGSLYGGAYPQRDFARILRLVESGRLDLERMVSAVLPLERVNDGLQALRDGTVVRAVLDLTEGGTVRDRVSA